MIPEMAEHMSPRRSPRLKEKRDKLVADGVEFDKQRGQARAATKNYKELYRKVRPSARSLRQTARAQHPPHTPSTACAQAKKKRLQRLDDAASLWGGAGAPRGGHVRPRDGAKRRVR